MLIEESEKRILIDPGDYSFNKLGAKASDVGPVDVILCTHPHNDHCWVPVIKELLFLNPNAKFLANGEIAAKLKSEGVSVQECSIPATYEIAGFKIETIVAPHEKLPSLWPHVQNNGFFINEQLFHAGDSFTFELPRTPKVLALGLMASWGSLTRSFEIAAKIKPAYFIPIHDGFLQPFYLAGAYEKAPQHFKQFDIQFRPLAPGEVLEI